MNSLLLNLFSSFDAYMGELISSIYLKRTELFKSLDRTMSISEMLKYESLEDVKSIILCNEIESLRRKSYIE